MKPILFNTEMVRAIQRGTKTVTRRVVKPQPVLIPSGSIEIQQGLDFLWLCNRGAKDEYTKAPYCPGDILYVRETWGLYHQEPGFYVYKADKHEEPEFDGFKWRPSIHMPSEAARIFLRVTDVRVERLQDITSYGIKKEGVVTVGTPGSPYRINPFFAFKSLWDSTIKPADRDLYGWDANPWIWVIEFERRL